MGIGNLEEVSAWVYVQVALLHPFSRSDGTGIFILTVFVIAVALSSQILKITLIFMYCTIAELVRVIGRERLKFMLLGPL